MRRGHILRDLFQHTLLRPGRLEREHRLDLFAHRFIQIERDTRLATNVGSFECQATLEPEELFKD